VLTCASLTPSSCASLLTSARHISTGFLVSTLPLIWCAVRLSQRQRLSAEYSRYLYVKYAISMYRCYKYVRTLLSSSISSVRIDFQIATSAMIWSTSPKAVSQACVIRQYSDTCLSQFASVGHVAAVSPIDMDSRFPVCFSKMSRLLMRKGKILCCLNAVDLLLNEVLKSHNDHTV
jgi:hypothetical protein